MGVRLVSTGSVLPERVVTNAELVKLGAPLSTEEMPRLSGIETRHWAGPEQATSDLATVACRRALDAGKLSAEQIHRLILATVSPDHPSPSTACAVQYALGLPEVPSFDVTAACAGFV